jgi:DNA-binding beta-propeller fold protein YncE
MQWGSPGSGNGQFNQPDGIAVDSNGNVYVSDMWNNRVQKFSSSGEYLTQWGSDGLLAFPAGLAVDDNNNVFVADRDHHRIIKFNDSGTSLTLWGSYGGSASQFNLPMGLAVDNSGNIYVADTWNHRIQKFSDGYPLPDSVSGLILNGSFEDPSGLNEWTYGGSLPITRTTLAYTGTYALRLGIPVSPTAQNLTQAWAYQTFYVSEVMSRPVLSFAYHMTVNDIQDYSDFFVEIQTGTGRSHLATVVRAGYQSCLGPNIRPVPRTDLAWRTVSYDMSPFKGQSVRVVFRNRNLHDQVGDESLGIWTDVDAVRVNEAESFVPAGPYYVYLPIVSNARCDR